MQEETLALAVLLAVGFAVAKMGQALRLPMVTGYICAGFLLGPAGFNIIGQDLLGERLDHFTQIALMLIALGIGEHLEIKRLRANAKLLAGFSIGEVIGTLFAVVCGTMLLYFFFGLGSIELQPLDFFVVAILLGTVSVATAPASTLHVMRETGSIGPLTTTLLQAVALNNGMAIILFGFSRAIARSLSGAAAGSFAAAAMQGTLLIVLSLTIGIITGLLIDELMHHLRNRAEMLIGGLALLLLSGEVARFLDLSPLLVGMAVGFTIVNRDRRDVRLFRVFNAFEPPILVLFFTLAGAALTIKSLLVAGWLGILYFLLRCLGKITGAAIGGRFVNAPLPIRANLGLALIPQAGIAIGLVFLVNSDPDISVYGEILTPVVLAGVFLSELIGPACTKFALTRAGETAEDETAAVCALEESFVDAELLPWTWEKLKPAMPPQGSIIFGASHHRTVAGLARLATLLAHYLKAAPIAVNIAPAAVARDPGVKSLVSGPLFDLAGNEVKKMGYQLQAATIEATNVAEGLVNCAREHDALALMLGYPLQHSPQQFKKVVEEVVNKSPCQVVLVRLIGILHTERILVPLVHSRHLDTITAVLCSLAAVGQHRITLLRLLPPEAPETELSEQEKKLRSWAAGHDLPFVRCLAIATEARLETIIHESGQHDLIVMAGVEEFSLPGKLFGSLADDMANKCGQPMVIVCGRSGNGKKEKIHDSKEIGA